MNPRVQKSHINAYKKHTCAVKAAKEIWGLSHSFEPAVVRAVAAQVNVCLAFQKSDRERQGREMLLHFGKA